MSKTRYTTSEKVVRKIEILEEYRETKQARFPIPSGGKFSFNWFCNLEGDGLEKVSKGLSCIRAGGELRERLNIALTDAQGTYDAIQKLDPTTDGDLAEMKRQRDELRKQLKRLAQDVLVLMIENERYRDLLGVKQAQFRDMSKVKFLAEQID